MSKSAHVLKIQKGGTTYTCDLYTTMAEARANLYPDYPLFRVNVGGTYLYAAFTTTLDSAKESTPLICPLFAGEGNDTKYCVEQKSCFSVGITTQSNETITVTASDKPGTETGSGSYSFTSGTKWFTYGTTWTAKVSPATGFNAGTVSPASGTVTDKNVTVTATAASLKTYALKVGSPAHQTVTVKYKNRNTANSGYEAEKSLAEGGSATVRHFTTWTATVTADAGWTAGALSPGASGTISAATTVTAGAATHKTFTLKLAATSHQTITLKYKNYNGSSFASEVTKTSTSSVQSFTVGYGTTWTATLAAATGYTKGTLSASSGTVKAATTVSATAATAITPKITFTWVADGWTPTGKITYTNTSGSSATATKPSSVTIKYNTKITITDTANVGTRYLQITQGSTYKTAIRLKQSWTSGALTSNTTFKIVGYFDEPSGGSGGEGSGGEGGA